MTMPEQWLGNLLDVLKPYLGDALLNVDAQPNRLELRVNSRHFSESAAFIYHHPALDTRYLSLVAADRKAHFSLHLLLLLRKQNLVLSLDTQVDRNHPVYPALSPRIPPAEWHERELHDLFGIVPEGMEMRPLVLHRDWPRGRHYPMRRDFHEVIPVGEVPHQFDMPEGPGYHQVAVGPIHAGIIEPGHLRFCVTGEQIHRFDAQLFYTHKGLEKMAEGKPYPEALTLAEHVCGLCAFSHSLAFSQALEELGEMEVPERVVSIRAILLEMERLASHFADLSAICSAGGFGFGAARAAWLREIVLQMNHDLTGHRFLRGINDVGGLKQDVPDARLEPALEKLASVNRQFLEWRDLVLHTDSFLDRVEETGFLSREKARELGLVGPSARGSGIAEDLRQDFPVGVHRLLPVSVKTCEEGDALARMKVRLDEVEESLSQIRHLISTLKPGSSLPGRITGFPAFQAGLGLVESAKGALLHWIMMGPDSRIYRWHVRSASYMNWRGMVYATMGNNIVPDGPLVNKSFNLCYACVDR